MPSWQTSMCCDHHVPLGNPTWSRFVPWSVLRRRWELEHEASEHSRQRDAKAARLLAQQQAVAASQARATLARAEVVRHDPAPMFDKKLCVEAGSTCSFRGSLDVRSCCREDQSRILAAAHSDYTQALSAAAAAADELAHCIAAEEPGAHGIDDGQPHARHVLRCPVPHCTDSTDSISAADSASQAEVPDRGVCADLQQHSSNGARPNAAICRAVSTASGSEQSLPRADTATGTRVESCSTSIGPPDHLNTGLSSAASLAADGSDLPASHIAPGDSEAEEDLAQLADVMETCLIARVHAQYRVTSEAVTRYALGFWTAS